MSRRSLIVVCICLTILLGGCTGGRFVVPASIGTLQVSGSTAAVRADDTAQFSVVAPTGTAVSWAVNGIDGGNDVFGEIYPDGRYAAPSTLPIDKQITISATSVSNPALTGSTNIELLNPVPVVFSAST